MHNIYLTQYFDWNHPPSWKVRFANAVLKKLRFSAKLVGVRATGTMTNVEQRINMYHLLSQVLVFGVAGAVVEIGSHEGSSAALFAKVIADHDPGRILHVFDAFQDPPAEVLLSHFRTLGLPAPVVHAGWFENTLPAELPEQICFAHVDAGPGRSPEDLERTLALGLETLYPRLAPKAVCLLADYCDPDVYKQNNFSFPHCINHLEWWHLYPQVKRACDRFFQDKPEKMAALYAGDFSHGFFRKQ